MPRTTILQHGPARRSGTLAVLSLILALAACGDSPPIEPGPPEPEPPGTEPPPGTAEPPPEPPEPDPPPDLFRHYVALGNSITSGVESHGLNDSTQVQAYPTLLARMADAPFALTLAEKPGCPPPLVGPSPTTTERVGGGGSQSCGDFRAGSEPTQSLAFPGFRIADAFAVPVFEGDNRERQRRMYGEMFGDRTLVDLMIEAQPSLISVWLGNNDALMAGVIANLDQLTPIPDFETSVEALAASIAEHTDADEVIWLSVVDPKVAPALQPGAYFWGLAQDPATAEIVSKPVHDNCRPFLPSGERNPRAANLVSIFAARDSDVAEISCADDARYVLSPAARQTIGTHISAFNAAIRSAAEAHDWIYIDVNTLIESELSDPNRIRKCQGLIDATTMEQFRAALASSCPAEAAPNFFGELLSFDGIHPSASGHEFVADAIAAALREKHGDIF
jgi:hypothetical protein